MSPHLMYFFVLIVTSPVWQALRLLFCCKPQALFTHPVTFCIVDGDDLDDCVANSAKQAGGTMWSCEIERNRIFI